MRHPFGVCGKWRVIATIKPPRGAGVDLASARLARADLPLHRHTPPRRSGFGTDRREGVRSTAAPWAPPAPKGAGGSVTILLLSADTRLLPAGRVYYSPFGVFVVLPPLELLHRMQGSGGADLGPDVGSARRSSWNIGTLRHH